MGGRGPPDTSEMFVLHVNNLSYDTRPDDLRDVFEKYGDIGDIYIPRDHHTQESRGFAFVRFRNRDDAENAMNKEDGKDFRGRELRIAFAKQRRPTHERGGYDRDRDRGGYGRDRSRDRYDRGGGGYDRGRDRGYDRRRSPSPRRRSRSRSPPSRRDRSRSHDRDRGGSRSRSRGR